VRSRQGELITASVEAPSENSLIKGLLKEQYCILEIKEIKSSGSNSDYLPPISLRDLAFISRMLATMLSAGLPVIRALAIIQDQTRNNKVKKLLSQITIDIERGYALHEALRRHPKCFSSVYVNLIKAGEPGGLLVKVLKRLGEYLEEEIQTKNRIITACIYPALILVFTIITGVLIIVFVMPTFAELLDAVGADMPGPSQILMLGSQFLVQNLFYLLLTTSSLLVVFRTSKQIEEVRICMDRLSLRLPLIGRLNAQVLESRFTRTMAILISSGIPVLAAMEMVEGVIENTFVLKALRQARENISEGQSIATPLQESGVFEPILIQMIAVGEETGTLDEMLGKISDYYEQEIKRSIERGATALEPLLIAMVAIIIGGIVLATLLPVFDLLANPTI
jgi:type IV pilus assembly protein PilC